MPYVEAEGTIFFLKNYHVWYPVSIFVFLFWVYLLVLWNSGKGVRSQPWLHTLIGPRRKLDFRIPNFLTRTVPIWWLSHPKWCQSTVTVFWFDWNTRYTSRRPCEVVSFYKDVTFPNFVAWQKQMLDWVNLGSQASCIFSHHVFIFSKYRLLELKVFPTLIAVGPPKSGPWIVQTSEVCRISPDGWMRFNMFVCFLIVENLVLLKGKWTSSFVSHCWAVVQWGDPISVVTWPFCDFTWPFLEWWSKSGIISLLIYGGGSLHNAKSLANLRIFPYNLWIVWVGNIP